MTNGCVLLIISIRTIMCSYDNYVLTFLLQVIFFNRSLQKFFLWRCHIFNYVLLQFPLRICINQIRFLPASLIILQPFSASNYCSSTSSGAAQDNGLARRQRFHCVPNLCLAAVTRMKSCEVSHVVCYRPTGTSRLCHIQ